MTRGLVLSASTLVVECWTRLVRRFTGWPPPTMLVVVMGAKGASPVASSEGVDLDCLSHCKAARQEGWRPVPLPRWVMQYSQCGQQFLQVDAGSVVQMATS